MVQQARYGAQSELANVRQAFVAPTPIAISGPLGRDALPQHWVTKRLQAQVGEAIQVVDAVMVAGAKRLVEERVAETVHGAFVTAPHLKRPHGTLAFPSRRIRKRQSTVSFPEGARPAPPGSFAMLLGARVVISLGRSAVDQPTQTMAVTAVKLLMSA